MKRWICLLLCCVLKYQFFPSCIVGSVCWRPHMTEVFNCYILAVLYCICSGTASTWVVSHPMLELQEEVTPTTALPALPPSLPQHFAPWEALTDEETFQATLWHEWGSLPLRALFPRKGTIREENKVTQPYM